MPRLTPAQYIKAHRQLRRFWLNDDRLFAELSPTEQWQLHDFFKPDKDWSDEQILEHRDGISLERPSLPHQAGRALAKFQERAAQLTLLRVRRAKAPAAPARHSKQGERHLGVKAEVRPEIDLKKLARALVYVAQEQRQRHGTQLGQTVLSRVVKAGFDPAAEPLSGDIKFILGRQRHGRYGRR